MRNKLVLLLILSLLFCACDNKLQSANRNSEFKEAVLPTEDEKENTENSVVPEVKKPEGNIKSIRYFRGGWYPARGQPSWSHDMTIDIDQSRPGLIFGKHFDSLCFRSGSLTNAEIESLLAEVKKLVVEVSTSQRRVSDVGVEVIEVKDKADQIKRIHLFTLSSKAGDNVAKNGQALSALLKSIGDNLSTGCP
jgi:protein involved in sex pheromone biosynthesis